MQQIRITRPATKLIFMAIGALAAINSPAQENEFTYKKLAATGFDYYKNKDYLKGATFFSRAFSIILREYNGYENIRYEAAYNAACCWAISGKPDSAFAALNLIIPTGRFNDVELMKSDKDLTSLHQDGRWADLCSIATTNKQRSEARLDQPLIERLRLIREDDQKYRNIYDAIRTRKDTAGTAWEMQTLKALMRYRDSINLITVSQILDKDGWLGPDKIGFMGTQTLFLVIQHSTLPTQEKYLPAMRQAVKEGKALARDLAFLEDRVAVRQGKLQLYGSQTWLDRSDGKRYVQPVEDPENLDKRRATVWLEPMSEYLEYQWDPKEYIRNLPEIEKRIRTAIKSENNNSR